MFRKGDGALGPDSISSYVDSCSIRAILLACYRRLQADELSALPQRLSTATAELQDVTDREKELQETYARLLQELDDARSGRVKASVAASNGDAAEHGTGDVSM